MFLRSLTIKGFKSFAEKTTLEFTPGISVIVGPNGSGKSNIADAIAWVLGEQGPRALRGGQMADVVFAGSPGRPALGMAVVSMVIDNTAGLIPVPASEIEITRAVYRSGESEYRLGGRPCRLMDIQELLSDTGVGRALHTLIGQGHLEDVLSARPEERRQLVEEAAGIAKHRRRRERAERKLTGLEQDLLRLQDVLGELRRQLRPLKQQAELARRHEELTLEAGDLARRLAGVRLRDLYQDRDRRRPSWQEAEERQATARARLEQLGREIDRLDGLRRHAEAAQARGEESHAGATRERVECERRFRQAIDGEAQARARLAAAENRSARLFAVSDELERTERALRDVSSSLEEREPELDAAEQEFRRLEAIRRDAEEDRRRAESEGATIKAEWEALRRTLAGHEAERGRLRSLLQELRARSGDAAARIDGLETDIERADAATTPLTEERRTLGRERDEITSALSELEAAEKGLLARQEIIDARVIELAESPGAAFARRMGGRPYGVLRELVGAPDRLRIAVRAALGPFADAVVYPSRDGALEDAGAGGGIVLLAASPDEDREPTEAPGHTAGAPAEPLLPMLRPDPRVRGLARRLLTDAYVVPNLAEATALHGANPTAVFVTPDGVVIGSSYVRTAPGGDGRAEELRRDSAAIERELAGLRSRIRDHRHRAREVTARLESLSAELEEADGTITVAAEEMAGLKAELASTRREEQLVADRAAALDVALEDARRRLDEVPAARPQPSPLPPHPELPIHLRVEVEALRRERGRLDAAVQRMRREVDSLAADDPEVLRVTVAAGEAERLAAEEAQKEAEAALDEALTAYRKATETARRAQADHAGANREWREQAAEVDRLREEHDLEDRARADLERRIADAERLLREGHGSDPVEVVATLTGDDGVEAIQRQADVVARRLGLLGRVNLLATGELEAVQERHDFLARELDDVRAARADLRDVIQEVDRQMAELFDSAFRDVAREYSTLFADLFPGGEGRLTLTDPTDLLGAGIEVEARPGGKRVKRLSLLSGGERSLAALAFLFSVFRARPSPFYLMDEVEAALDDVNLSRFLRVMQGFADTSQILVVTHQKRSMEVADVLYGVSMGKDGASRVISQRLADVAVR